MQKIISACLNAGLLIFLFISNSTGGFSQSTKGPLSLRQALELADKNYPSIKSRMENVRAATATVTATRHEWLPTLNLHEQVDLGSVNSLTSSYFAMGIIPSASGGRRSENISTAAMGNIAAVAGEWELYNFGGYKAKTDASIAFLQVNEAGLEKEKYQIDVAVIKNYFELLKYESLIKIQEDNINRTQVIRKAIQAFVNSGLKPGVDSSVAEAELSKARLTLLEFSNSYNMLKSELSMLSGLDTSQVIADTTMNSVLMNLLSAAQTLDTSYSQHPVLRYYQSLYNENLAQQNLIRKANLPKLSLTAAGWMRGSSISPTDEYKDLVTGLSYTRYNYLAGLSITYDLFDLRRTKDQLNIQKFRSQSSWQDYQEQKSIVINNIYQADINVQTAIQRLKEIPVQEKAANDAYTQKLALYNSGLANIVDLTNALYILNRAETDRVLANDAAWNSIFLKAISSNQLPQLLSNLK